MSRLSKVKQLVNDEGINTEVQETYNRRLKEGQVFINNLELQADEAIKQLETELNITDSSETLTDRDNMDASDTTSNEISEESKKKEVIALYRTYEKVPFFSEKLDVILVATANTVLRQLVVDQAFGTEKLRQTGNQKNIDINNLQMMKLEYQQLSENVDQLLTNKKGQLDSAKERYIQQKQRQRLPVDEISANLDELLRVSEKSVIKLNNALKSVLIKYLSFDSFDLDKAQLNNILNVLLKLFKTLMKNVTSGTNEYMTLTLSPIEVSLVQNLAMNEIVLIKLSQDNQFTIKLRDYSK